MKQPTTAEIRAARKELYRRDFPSFAKHELKIKGISPGELLPLVLDSGQQLMESKVAAQLKAQGYIRLVILKGRQSGSSTWSQARVFHSTIHHQNYSTLLVAHDDPGTARIFDMSRTFYQNMSPAVRPMRCYWSKKEILFENPNKREQAAHPGLGSRIDFQTAANILSGTGTTRHALHLSEVSKWYADQCKLLVSSLLPAIHRVPGTMIIEESTAYIGGDHFRDMWDRAASGKTEYAACFVPWWFNERNHVPLLAGEKLSMNGNEKRLQKRALAGQPKHDVPPREITIEQFKWMRAQQAELGDLFDQEYPEDPDSAWVSLEANVFNKDLLWDARKHLREPLRFVTIVTEHKGKSGRVMTERKGGELQGDANYCAIFAEPEPGVEYDMGVDVAEGHDDGDWTVAEIFRRDTHDQVAEYHRHIHPTDAATELYWFGKMYNTAQIGVEMSGPGYSTGGALAAMYYPYLYRWRHREREVPTMSTYMGWKMTHESKKLCVAMSSHLFLHRELIIRSRVLLSEMSAFVRKGLDDYGAFSGHDDCVIGMLIANQIAADENVGVPKELPSDEPKPVVVGPAFQDNKDFSVKPDRIAADIARQLRGSA